MTDIDMLHKMIEDGDWLAVKLKLHAANKACINAHVMRPNSEDEFHWGKRIEELELELRLIEDRIKNFQNLVNSKSITQTT